MRNRWGWAFWAAAYMLLAVGLFVVHRVNRTKPGLVSEHNYGRVAVGMTPAEVRALLGRESDHVDNMVPTHAVCGYRIGGGHFGLRWRADTVTVMVEFDSDDKHPEQAAVVLNKYVDGTWDGP